MVEHRKMSLNFLFTILTLFCLSNAEFNNFFEDIKSAIKAIHFNTNGFNISSTISQDIAKTITIDCYNPKSRLNSRLTDSAEPQIPTKLDLSQKIGFLFHGWRDSSDQAWVNEVYAAWTQNRRENICRVDWSFLASADYVNASRTNTILVANYMVQFLNGLNTNHNVKHRDIILIGHSLGAHVCGIIGYEVSEPIGLIIGLDPPGPLFTIPTLVPHRYRLDSQDALIVQVIHSSDGAAGPTVDIGRQDFRINTGFIPQRGCSYPNLVQTYHTDVIRCSHFRSVQFFKSSLINSNKCRAIRCDNLLQYFLKSCSNVYDVIGLDTKGLAGTFYLASLDEPECINQQYKK